MKTAHDSGVYDPLATKKVVALQRQTPHNAEAELAALASAAMDSAALGEVLDRLTIEYFYLPVNQLLFAALQEFDRQQKPIDLVTFTNALRDGLPVENLPESFKRGRLERNGRPVISLEEVGGAFQVTNLFTFLPTGANVSQYVDILREKFLARTIIAKCTELVRIAYDEQTEMREVLEQTQSTLTEIIMHAERPETFRDLKEGVITIMKKIEHAYHNRGSAATNLDGLATGFHDFDRMTYGLRPQQLIIIGARPSQGKTAMAMNIAVNLAFHNQVPVGVFSMEMSYDELLERIFCSVSGITINKFRSGLLSRHEYDHYRDHTPKLMDAPIWIDDTASLPISSFKARARLMRIRHGVKAIVVDYLQLMRSLTRRAQESRWIEITEISGTLKASAKELNIPIIVCCQLNREAEARDSSFCKPRLADLRESGSIEQDADIVAMLWRPDRHLAPPKFDKRRLANALKLKDGDDKELWKEEKDLSPEQITERDCQIEEYCGFLVVKQRNGPVKDLRLRFLGDLTLFQNVTKELYSNDPAERQA